MERSERSRDALALARTLAGDLGTRLILVSVYPGAARSHAMAQEAEAALDWVARPLGGPRRIASRALQLRARGLQAVADAEGALAIVVGPSHRGPAGGSCPAASASACSTGRLPGGGGAARLLGRRRGIKRIGVGYMAVRRRARRSAPRSASRPGPAPRTPAQRRRAPTVAATLPLGWGFGELEATKRDDLTRRIGHAIEDVAATVEISGEVVDGYADDELARLSREVDLLICGSRGHGPIGSVTLGNASTGVMRKAHCPVLVVPRGARDGFAALRGAASPASRRRWHDCGFPTGSCAGLRTGSGWLVRMDRRRSRTSMRLNPSAETRG